MTLGKRRSLIFYSSLRGDRGREPFDVHMPQTLQTGCPSFSYRKAQAPTQVGLILGPAVPELAGFRGPVQAVLEAGSKQIAPDT